MCGQSVKSSANDQKVNSKARRTKNETASGVCITVSEEDVLTEITLHFIQLTCRHMENLHWICEDCNPVATRTWKMLTKMYEKQELSLIHI